MKLNSDRGRFAYVIRLCIIYLMAVFMISIPMTVSRYTSDTEGKSTGYVAKFDVDHVIKDPNATEVEHIVLKDLYPGMTPQKYTIKIDNKSDVSIQYTVAIETLNALPLQFSWDNSAYSAINETSSTSDEIVFGDSDTATKTLELYIKWDAAHNDIAYTEEVDLLTITLDFEQVD